MRNVDINKSSNEYSNLNPNSYISIYIHINEIKEFDSIISNVNESSYISIYMSIHKCHVNKKSKNFRNKFLFMSMNK